MPVLTFYFFVPHSAVMYLSDRHHYRTQALQLMARFLLLDEAQRVTQTLVIYLLLSQTHSKHS